MSHILIIPGWRDSPAGHWQSLWADQLPGAVRVQQDDWLTPSRQAWVASITRATGGHRAHSRRAAGGARRPGAPWRAG